MWLAICSEKACQWEYEATSQDLAEDYFLRHVLESGHLGAVVELPLPDHDREAEVARRKKAA